MTEALTKITNVKDPDHNRTSREMLNRMSAEGIQLVTEICKIVWKKTKTTERLGNKEKYSLSIKIRK